jgi:hypothetical protein
MRDLIGSHVFVQTFNDMESSIMYQVNNYIHYITFRKLHYFDILHLFEKMSKLIDESFDEPLDDLHQAVLATFTNAGRQPQQQQNGRSPRRSVSPNKCNQQNSPLNSGSPRRSVSPNKCTYT